MLLRWLVIALVTAVALVAVLHHNAYGSWPTQLPEKLSWCDRTYSINRVADGPKGRVHELFRAPPVIGHKVFASETRQEAERRQRENQVCGFALYLRTDDGYVSYVLSGGP